MQVSGHCWTIKHFIQGNDFPQHTFVANSEKAAYTQCYLLFNIIFNNDEKKDFAVDEELKIKFLSLKEQKRHREAIDLLANHFLMRIEIKREGIYSDDSCDEFIVHLTPALQQLDKLNKINELKG